MKKYKIILISFAALLLIMGAVGAAEADDVTNGTITGDNMGHSDDILCSNNYSDVAGSNQEFNGNTFSQLQSEINGCSDNDIIILKSDIAQTGSQPISIKKSLTIDGNGHTIDAQQKSGIFNINSGAKYVTLKNMILKNAKDEDFGAVYISGADCYFDNCTFEGNKGGFNGAAIQASSGGLDIVNCTFKDNAATGKYGGAIYSETYTYITDCTFSHNSAGTGGAIYCEEDLSLTYCSFDYNSATNDGGAVFSKDISLTFSNFTENHAKKGGAVYCANYWGTISGADFTCNRAVDGGAIYWNGSEGTMEYNKFINNTASGNGGAVFLNSFNQIYIGFNSFFNSSANKEGGALYFFNSTVNIVSGFFINNNALLKGGAISSVNSDSILVYCDFERNVAKQGGAMLLNNSQSNITGSNFEYNVASEKGAAIYFAPLTANLNCSISSSDFFNNKVKSYSLTADFVKGILFLELTGWNNYINAIYADSIIAFKDVEYWNGNMTNTDIESYYSGASGQNIILEIYDSQNNLLTTTTMMTNTFGQQYLDLALWDDGSYTYKAYHSDNDYYTYAECRGSFTLKRASSSISLNISEYDEFIYNQCSIPFNVINRTDVRVVITNEYGAIVYYNYTVNEFSSRVKVDLDACDEYYRITVYNLRNSIYHESLDSRLFKILKTDSSISINPIKDAEYGRKQAVIFNVDNRTNISITIYDENGTEVYQTVTDTDFIITPLLPVGKYHITAENIGNVSINGSSDSTTFNILKATNFINISAENVDYENITIITIRAWADGNYTLDVNGTLSNVSVIRGQGKIELSLPSGQYHANATLNNPNYNPAIADITFTVLPLCNIDVSYNEDVVGGENMIFNVTVSNNATGNITLYFGNDEYTRSISNGSAIIEVLNVDSGYREVSIRYGGDENYAANKIDFMVHVKEAVIMFGMFNSNAYSARLYDENGNGISNREVLFSIDGVTFKAITDSDGIASVNLDLTLGSHNIEVSYLSQNIIKNITVASRFSGNKDINMFYFDGSKYTFKVYGDDGKPVGANQNVMITLNNKNYALKTDKNGVVSFTIPKTVKIGVYTITATYKGESIKNTVKVKQILTSKKTVKVKRTAKKLVLKAKLKKKLKGKTIVFKFKGKKYKAKTNKNGIAKITIKKNVIKKLKRGKTYKVNIYYYNISLKTEVKVK